MVGPQGEYRTGSDVLLASGLNFLFIGEGEGGRLLSIVRVRTVQCTRQKAKGDWIRITEAGADPSGSSV